MPFKILVALAVMVSHSAWATEANNPLKIELEKRSLQYFLDNANLKTGLVLDRVSNFLPRSNSNHVASTAATGFGLMVITNASLRGRVDKQVAQDYALRTLKFARDHIERFHGFFQHWVDWETGASVWESDFSTIDTALFMAGALYAAQVFPNTEVANVANQLYADMDFYVMMTDGGVFPNRRTLSLTYSKDTGFSRWQWSIYAENIILYILGLGSPTHALPAESWAAFDRGAGDIGDGTPLMGYDMPMFIHQYSLGFLDLRNFDDGQPNYYRNSKRATEYNRRVSFQTDYKTYKEGFWGLSAGDAPNTTHYLVYGPASHVSAACIGCVVGSAMFTPELVMKDVGNWISGPYKDKITGRYGLVDSVDLDHDWFSQDFLAITVGMAYLSLANMNDKTSVWTDFMKIPSIQKGLARAQAVPPRIWKP